MNDTLDTLYARIRAEELAAREARVADAFARAPELAAIDEARSRAFDDVGARTLTPAEGVAALKKLERRERELLASLGLPADTLALHYRCEACKDTGYIDGATKRPCACRLRYRELQKPSADINTRETFPNFSESVFPDETQRKRTRNAKILCERYAAALPHPALPNLLLTGMPGLGKSFLGNAIAYEAICSGVDTVRVTAYRFVQDMLEDIRTHSASAANRYSAVPLLVLDDLGSEPNIPNVSIEWLFAIINERVMRNLATVCITNLSLKGLQERYGERLMSRLCDRNTTTVIQLTGENLRTI